MGRLLLVLGGARSGKSAYAQRLAQELGGDDVLFVATAEAWDEDMAQRIARHQQERPVAWRTLEIPRRVGQALIPHVRDTTVVLVDCLTLWINNLMAEKRDIEIEIQGLIGTLHIAAGPVLIVTNEVGLGIVPDNPLARAFRDNLGRANQLVAGAAEVVVFMVAGIPLVLKGTLPG